MSGKSAKRRRRRKGDRTRWKPLMQRLKSRGLLKEGQEVLFEPSDKEKMSEVILEFIEPYMKAAPTRRALNRLICVALVAWNAALLDATACRDLIDDVVNSVLPCDDEEGRVIMRQTINELVERKKRYFAGCKRFILDYQISEAEGGNFRLSVVSTAQQEESTRS